MFKCCLLYSFSASTCNLSFLHGLCPLYNPHIMINLLSLLQVVIILYITDLNIVVITLLFQFLFFTFINFDFG